MTHPPIEPTSPEAAGPTQPGDRDLAEAITVIGPPGGWPTLGLHDAWRYRSTIVVLARRAIKVRYRQTVVGLGWVLIQPILLMIVFTLFFSALARESGTGVPFPVYFFTGVIAWQFASKVVNEGSGSIAANGSLIGRVWFPRVYLPVSVALASMVDLAFMGLALVVLLALFGVMPGVEVVAVPAVLAIGLATALGAAMWLAALSVRMRDVAVVLPVITQLWFFCTPVIYPVTLVPDWLLPFYYLNPLALVVTGMRWAVLDLPPPPDAAWVTGATVALVLLVSGYLFFRRREPTFADTV